MITKITIIGLLISVLLLPSQVQSLSCNVVSKEDNYKMSSMVALVEVESLIDNNPYKANARVIISLKGPSDGSVVVIESENFEPWGQSYKVGKQYIIYATDKDPYWVGLCSFSRALITDEEINNPANSDAVRKDLIQHRAEQQELLTNSSYNNPLVQVPFLHYPIIKKPLAIFVIILTTIVIFAPIGKKAT